MAKNPISSFVSKLSFNLELVLLYLPLLFLIFPQQPAYFHARAIFWLFPFLYFFVIVSKKRQVGKNFHIYSFLFSLFIASSLLSSFFSASRGMSLIKAADYLAVLLYSINFYLIVDSKQKLKLFTNLLLFTGLLLVALSAYFQFFVPSPRLGGINLFYPTHGHNHIVAFLLLILPLGIINCFKAKKKSHLIVHCSLFTVYLFSLFLSFSRSSYLIFPIIISLLIYKLRPRFKSLLPMIFVAAIPVGLIIATLGSSFASISQDLPSTAINQNWLLRQTIKPLNLETRPHYWNQAISSFKDHSIFGYGPGTFRLASLRYRGSLDSFSFYTHNSLLQILSDQSLIGLLTFSPLILFLFSKLFPLGSVISSLHLGIIASRNSTTGPHQLTQFSLSLGLLSLFLLSLLDFSLDFLLILTLFFSSSAILLRQSEKTLHPLNPLSKNLLLSFSLLLFIFALLFTTARSIVLYTNSTPTSADTKLERLKLATTIFPLDPDLTEKYLDQIALNSQPPHLKHAQHLISTWHTSNPNLLTQLAETSNDDQTKTDLLTKSITLNPLDTKPSAALFKLYTEASDYEKIVSLALQNLLNHHAKQMDQPLTNQQENSLTQVFTQSSNQDAISATASKLTLTDSSKDSLIYSVLLYNLGLSQYKLDSPEDTIILWQLSTTLSPQWSYFHTELANLHIINDDNLSAQKTIEICLTFEHPKSECQLFLDQNLNPNQSEPVGYLDNTISTTITDY